MSRATTIAYANTLLDSLGDTTQLTTYYDNVVLEIALGRWPDVVSLVDAAHVAVVAEDGVYAFPTAAIRVIGLHYDARELAEATPGEADSFDRQWRITRGEPLAFVTSGEDHRDVRLVPVPAANGAALAGNTPFNWTTWKAGNLTFVYTKTENDMDADEELFLALEIAARELSRDSNHHDSNAADLAKQLASVFLKMSHTG